MTNESLIELLVAELERPVFEGCDYRSGIRKAIAIFRQHQADLPSLPDNLGKLIGQAMAEGDVEGVLARLRPYLRRTEGETVPPASGHTSETPDTSLTALEALTFLVSLKAHKDQFGKTPYYEMWQPRAWERAIKAMGNESLQQPEPVSSDPEHVNLMVGAQAIGGALAERGVAIVNELPLTKACAEAWGTRWK